MFRYLGLLLRLKDIRETYEEEKNQGKPIWLSKRLIGLSIALIAGALTLANFNIDQGIIDQLTTHAETLIPAAYGIVMLIKGLIDRYRVKPSGPENKGGGNMKGKNGIAVAGMIAIFFFVAMLAVPGPMLAQEGWPDRSGAGKVLRADAPKAEVLKAETASTASAFKFGLDNLSGDVAILWKGSGGSAGFAPGVGLDIMTYKEGLLTFRAQAFFESEATLGSENATVFGASVMVNLIKAVGMIPDTSWLAKTINPSLGFFGGYDVVSGQAAYGPMLSIVVVSF